MTKEQAQHALQRFYDWDKIGNSEFEARYAYGALIAEARGYFSARHYSALADDADGHIGLYIELTAREALAVLGLVAVAP